MSSFSKSPMQKNSHIRIFATVITAGFFMMYSCKNQDTAQEINLYRFQASFEPIVDSILLTMTLEEKINMLHGNGKFTSGGIERAGLSEITYTDGPTGIREELERDSWQTQNITTDSATFFPTGTALAATWNKELAYKLGEGIGLEARARGKDILLAPAINIIRTPLCGRNFEYFTEDPYLNSEMAVGYVRGVQNQNVAACVKHYAANNQETERGRVSVEMSERALREIYLPAFEAVVKQADAYAMMGAYNKFRGVYLCQNDYLNNQILKREFGFKGIVISDWGATHNTVQSAMGGLDVEMGTRGTDYNNNYMGLPLRDSVLAGIVPDSVIDDKVRRILRVMLNCRKDKPERINGEINTPYISRIAYNIASESIVLLKNEGNLLPIQKDKPIHIAVIGQNAVQPQSFGGFTASVKAKYEISPLEGIKQKAGDQITISYAKGYEPEYESINGSYFKYPSDKSNSGLIEEAVELAKKADIVIMIGGTNRNVETEATDRKDIKLPFGQDELIKAVTSVNKNTITVIVAGAPCDLKAAKTHSSALIYSWFNGSEAGNALADVLFGEVNPSGKLPFTLPEQIEDIGVHALNAYPGEELLVEYKEGIYVGYRWFDAKDIEPLYPFGYGLSYTRFEFTHIDVRQENSSLIGIECTISNSGMTKGKEVIQCYIRNCKSSVSKPDKELKAFQKIELNPDEESTVYFSINKSDLQFYDEENSRWKFEPGEYTVMIGSSSRDIKLTKSIEIQ